ncbi:tellurite resistance TerB C-terminal domain-containing protein [Pedobacter lithocola]|uniref:Tellurite resistance TerB C-terminal domain-containing protein n=1 Tax=Pedobacter lithocola TaxID=1908239 RepID=A0ABV8PGR7_9SPHI
MIGFYLLCIGLTIVFLTTPKARKKIVEIYTNVSAFFAGLSNYAQVISQMLFKNSVKKSSPKITNRKINNVMIDKNVAIIPSPDKAPTLSYSSLKIAQSGKTIASTETLLPIINYPCSNSQALDITSAAIDRSNPGIATEIENSNEKENKADNRYVIAQLISGLIEKINTQSAQILEINQEKTIPVNWNPPLAQEKVDTQSLVDQVDTTTNKQDPENPREIEIVGEEINQAQNLEAKRENAKQPEQSFIYSKNEIHSEKTEETDSFSLEQNEMEDIWERRDSLIDEVIEIDEDNEPIDQEKLSFRLDLVIPSWPHRYIYSFSDLNQASSEQKEFYGTFKQEFLQGNCIDTLGNSNYYFILLFDLLQEYESHRDIVKLEKLIDRLSAAYPRTRSYAMRFLLEKMHQASYTQGITRLENRITTEISYMSWDWRSRYRDKLKLSKADMDILEKISLPSNAFVSIPFCGAELVKLYIRSVKVLQEAYKRKNLSQKVEFDLILDLIARKERRYHLNSSNYNYEMKYGSNGLYGYILKYCEQLLRAHYHFKKLSGFERQYTHAAVQEAVKEHITIHIEEALNELSSNITPLDEQTEKALYTIHPTRWKSTLILDQDQDHYQKTGKQRFIAHAEDIIKLNNSNPSLEQIYLELSRFLCELDKQLSIEYFLKYAAQNVSALKLGFKEMPKSMSKKLFKEPASETRFLGVLLKVIKREISISEVLMEVKDFYEPIRKKIKLDENAIQKVQSEFSGTVGLLGEFLSDEDPEEQKPAGIHTPEAKSAEALNNTAKNNTGYKIDFKGIEAGLLELFEKNDFTLESQLINDYCISTGTMSSVLINNLNENCYELIDDLLIEQEGSHYYINKDYYAQIKDI